MKRLRVSALFFAAILAPQIPSWSQLAGAQLVRYDNPEKGFSAQYPSDWRKAKVKEAAVTFIAPRESPSDSFQENVNISVEPVPASAALEEFSQKNLSQITQRLENAKILESGESRLGQLPARRAVYTGRQRTDQGEFDLKFLQVWALKDGRAYIFTYTAAEESFVKHQAAAEEIIRTFQAS